MTHLSLWKKQIIIVTIATLLFTLPFWFTHLDLLVSGYFYHPGTERAFPLKYQPFWYALYKLIPILSVLVAITSLAAITLSYLFDDWRKIRRPAIAIFLTFLLGPGLLVNGVFKEHYGRPRPAQVEEFGGKYPYVAPLVYGGFSNAKSFPSGHSSVAFAFIIFYFLLRKRKPRLAKLSAFLTLLLGCATGMARIVGGGHFLSDVLWSFYMVTVTAILVHHFVIERNTKPTNKASKKQRIIAIISASILASSLFIWLLVSLPFEMKQQQPLKLDGIKTLTIDVPKGYVNVKYLPEVNPYIEVHSEGYGFRPMLDCKIKQQANSDHLTMILMCKGWYREARQKAVIYLPKSLQGHLIISEK